MCQISIENGVWSDSCSRWGYACLLGRCFARWWPQRRFRWGYDSACLFVKKKWFCMSLCLHSFGTFTWLLRLLFCLKVGLHGIFIWAHKPAGHAGISSQLHSPITWLEQQFHFHRTVKPGHRQLTSPIPVGKVKHMIIVLLYWSNQYSLNRAMNKSTH